MQHGVQHLGAGHIRPSSSLYASPAFLIPKPDSVVLPRWVNDYHQLNINIVTDHYPLHRIDNILTNTGTGKIWSKLDMTDSFFHTRMHPDSIPLTTINTPFGLYEWTVMPQGMKNSPSVHQHRVNEALHKFIGKFGHTYLNNIIICIVTQRSPNSSSTPSAFLDTVDEPPGSVCSEFVDFAC